MKRRVFDLPPMEGHVSLLLLVFMLAFKSAFFYKNVIFAPFLPIFSLVSGSLIYKVVVMVMIWASSFFILIRKFNRIACLGVSLSTFIQILGNQHYYSTNSMLICCIFLLLSINPSHDWYIRIQMSIVYLGSFLFKVTQMDWRSGQYFDHFFNKVFPDTFFNVLKSLLDDDFLYPMFSWGTMFVEALLCIILLFPALTKLTKFSMMLFHGGMLIFTYGQLSVPYFFISFCVVLLLKDPANSKYFSLKGTENPVKYIHTPKNILIKVFHMPEKGRNFNFPFFTIYIFSFIYIVYFRFLY
ncbi:MAG TPA: hypothetical protein PKC30_05230 [Saprospiraceae bacterium]|mgnify:CR=1 FL=1|nr:hypothetical protein [Saprospiraceae bacterium]